MNRYQKPEVYEQLAMEYSLGTLHGRARKRFEGLMEQHPYLQAIVEDNNRHFAGLVEFLPETKPADSVWENINSRINEWEDSLAESKDEANALSADVVSKQATSTTQATLRPIQSWWQFLSNKGLVTAMVLLLVSAVFLLKPGVGTGNQTIAYSANLSSEATKESQVNVLIKKSDLLLTIKVNELVPVAEGMKMVFWCIAKDKSKPIMNMGVVASEGMTIKKLELDGWQGIVDAEEFAVSIEPAAAVTNSSPSGKMIFVGKLRALTKT